MEFKVKDKVKHKKTGALGEVVGHVGDFVNVSWVGKSAQYDGGYYAHNLLPLKSVGAQLTKAEYLEFIQTTFDGMTKLIKAKNSDYTAGSDDPFANFRQSSDYGVDPLAGVMLRMGDKLQRIKSFTKNGKLEVADEGVEDAFRDLIGYSLIALGMLSERKQD